MAKKVAEEENHAERLAKEQKAISVSQFFERNRHLLGFDNPIKALSTTIKELVDNSLDACQEINILPEIIIQIKKNPKEENRFVIIVEDNGPGIVKEQIPRVFAKLLYGSKFSKMKQSRGQQGIGVSASVLYGQLTTGKSSKITSRISPKRPAHFYELHIDISNNEPEIVQEKEIEWTNKDHGTKVEIELEGKYQRGKLSVDEYIKQTAISNPHANITYIPPDDKPIKYKRVTDVLPKEPLEIKPHPYGVEIGVMLRMLNQTKAKTLQQFFTSEFSRVSPNTAKEICDKANISVNVKPSTIIHTQADALFNAIKKVKIMAPPTNCLSPITEEILIKGLKKEIPAEFYTATTRPPTVYRGMPFQIECAFAYGGELPKEELAKIMRFANRVPLQYMQSACTITKGILSTAWKNYGISQSKGALPAAPLIITVHIASVWVPFTSESKEAIAHYPEITKEIKLALQECGRKLGIYIRRKRKDLEVERKKSYIIKYIPHVSGALQEILELSDKKEQEIQLLLKKQFESSKEAEDDNQKEN
ncbi:MAG: DNA topoisomerase VI subunit B [Nanoarchaeota archaeon]|nr:DNA topoisomerase VI subunit B [Nanoarchaeota archaeon]